ncbi:MAG: bifunctional demethylmenaquinone methyltransferase/2-methoxy-6-polyprenyl-1,4-benzoquinol methylase UbiE [Caldisericia bacterium]|nr:bifunctional demethylmenaquinone methyltransferase/2-methoxy-6-polyprenyl-1,4-benzoquinol methylase UbiE [Caldisericia bacterium]
MSDVRKHCCYTQDTQKELVKGIFSTISVKYDFLNHLLSFGQDISWRKRTISSMRFFSTMRCIDIATGTGDVAFEVANKYPSVSVDAIDFAMPMINEAKNKYKKHGNNLNINFQYGDATKLNFPDDSFDVAIISFGIRNIPNKQKALNEMARVIVPGGQAIVLEMVSHQNKVFKTLYQWYLCYGLPFIANIFSQNRKAYEYLSNSIVHFPSIKEFQSMLQKSGLKQVKSVGMTLGITRMFVGIK